ncbi:MAG TPA: beta-ketoacyl-ACP synthase II [Pyrinomonadaceae bacterium]|jgi:3-oxoacyl-[acyl-carrier-protein] synthase II
MNSEKDQKRRVVVTGLGAVTPLGNSVEATWKALLAGESGADYITKFDARDFPVRFAAEVKNFDPLDYFEKKQLKRVGEFARYAVAAADEALRDSRLPVTDETAENIGTYVSSGIGDFRRIEDEHTVYLEKGQRFVSPFFMATVFANLAAGNISIRHGLKGPNSSTSTACAAGNHAIGDSFKIIQRGDADAMVCGGAEATITPMAMAGFASMKALSTRNDAPQKASRPFDAARDGFVVGEGSGILVLEELEHAKGRGAQIYAEVAGYGMTSDAFHITAPDETQSGVVRVMQRAIKDAGVSAENIDYINVHGTSTPLGDISETRAVKKTFGEHAHRLAISSTKSSTGHLLGAAGGVEAIFSILAIYRQTIPPTINYENPDPECDLDYVPNAARAAKLSYALSNGFGFGGTNAALVFKRYDGE